MIITSHGINTTTNYVNVSILGSFLLKTVINFVLHNLVLKKDTENGECLKEITSRKRVLRSLFTLSRLHLHEGWTSSHKTGRERKYGDYIPVTSCTKN